MTYTSIIYVDLQLIYRFNKTIFTLMIKPKLPDISTIAFGRVH